MSIRFGIIGCGAIGQRRHIPECHANPHTEIVALCDVRADRVKEVAAKYGVAKTYTDYKQMLKGEQLDAVIVGTPNAFHAEQSIAALNAGAHVLVEKPMAGSLADAKAMIKASDKAKKFLMVGQNQRLAAPHVKAKQILESGRLGKAISFQTSFKHAGPDLWSVDGAASWFFRKPEAVMGVCGDLGVHKIDLMRYLLGQEFTEVTAKVETINKTDPKTGKPISVDDNALLVVKTDAGVIGTIQISWTNYGRVEDNGTAIFCENGVLTIATDPQYGVVEHLRDGGKSFHQVGKLATNEVQTGSGVCDLFVQSIRTNTPPAINAYEGYCSLEVILGAMESSKTGKHVKCKQL
jgi:predicted dehydrogenase